MTCVSCRVSPPSLVLYKPGGQLADTCGPVQHAAHLGDMCLDDFRRSGLESGGGFRPWLRGGRCFYRCGRALGLAQFAASPKAELSGQHPLDQPKEVGDDVVHAAALAAGLQLIEDILALLLGQPMQGGLNVLLLPGLDALKARWQWQAGGFFVFAWTVRMFFILTQTIRRRRIRCFLAGGGCSAA